MRILTFLICDDFLCDQNLAYKVIKEKVFLIEKPNWSTKRKKNVVREGTPQSETFIKDGKGSSLCRKCENPFLFLLTQHPSSLLSHTAISISSLHLLRFVFIFMFSINLITRSYYFWALFIDSIIIIILVSWYKRSFFFFLNFIFGFW